LRRDLGHARRDLRQVVHAQRAASAWRSRRAISYTLGVSTHYPASGVSADGGGPVYYQQQVLGTVARSAFGDY
jgi:hypothetical protein